MSTRRRSSVKTGLTPYPRVVENDEFTAFIGIDWADRKHDICLQGALGGYPSLLASALSGRIRHSSQSDQSRPQALAHGFRSARGTDLRQDLPDVVLGGVR